MKKNRGWIFPVSLFCGAAAFLIAFVMLYSKAPVESSLPIVSVETASADSLLPALTPSSSPSAVPSSTSPAGTLTPTNAPDVTPTPSPTPNITPTPAPTSVQTPASVDAPEAAAQSGEIIWYDGYADPRTIIAETVTNPENLTVLVNKYFAIPETYAPDLVLAESSKNQYIRTEANDAWNLMRGACEADTGSVLLLCSGYRTFEAQAALYSKSITDKGIAHACSRNALEGRSEHNLGLALDISTTDVGVISSGFAKTSAGKWVGEHCAEYGFILRYPQDKTAITGYVYEPWHYRYVGVDLAEALYASGQTLEEYYGKVPVVPEASDDADVG